MLLKSLIFRKISRSWRKESTSIAATHFPEGLERKAVVVDPAVLRNSSTSAKEQRIWTLMEGDGGTTAGKPRHGKEAVVQAPTPPRYIVVMTEKLKLYGNLVRFDRPTGWQLLLLPCCWGSSLAVTKALVWEGADPLVLFAPFFPLHLFVYFLTGAYLMRSAGCIVNDIWDRKIDSMVERTATRPLACGAISMREAVAILLVHFFLAGFVAFSLSPLALMTSLAITPLCVAYPLMKRFTFAPQIILGFCFNWGIFVGYAAVLGRVDLAVCLPMYAAAVCWTVLYDTIYAYQDYKDDVKCGVKSMAIWIGDRKYILHAMVVPIGVGMLLAGIMASQSLPYYIGILGCVYYLNTIVDNVNIYDGWSCAHGFKRNVKFGVYVLLAMCAGNALWAFVSEHEQEKDWGTNTLNSNSALSRFLFLDSTSQPRLYNASNFNWVDRVVHPVFVQVETAKAAGATEPPPIPAWMRREYFGDNVRTLLKFCNVPEAYTAAWVNWWYSTIDHYNMFSKLKI